jgi:protein arginine N-methyltransferase 1
LYRLLYRPAPPRWLLHSVCADPTITIIEQAREIVEANGFSDVITLVRGKVEEVTLPNGIEKVDVIISEWMGYFLLYEGMLDTVIYARDKWLAPGGIVLPDKASLYLVAIEDAEYRREKLDFWDSVYGFDMSSIKRMALYEPLVDVVDPSQVCTAPHKILEIDILTATVADLAFASTFTLPLSRTDFVHALVGYFDVTFSCCHKPVILPTAPAFKPTHWKQTVFYLPETLVASLGDEISGEISVRPNETNPRDLEIVLTVITITITILFYLFLPSPPPSVPCSHWAVFYKLN